MSDETNDNSAIQAREDELKQRAKRVEGEVMRKNIYKRSVFESLVRVSNDIQVLAWDTHSDFEKVLADIGIRNPYEVFLESLRHWDRMLAPSQIPPEEQLIQQLQQGFQLNVQQVADVFVPTGEQEFAGPSGQEESKEKGPDVNRVSLALDALVHMELHGQRILLDDLEVTVGRIPDASSRTRPYWVIDLKNEHIAIFLNNQHANRTFVIGYRTKNELKALRGCTKEQLKEIADRDPRIHHFIFSGAEEFKATLTDYVKNVSNGLAMIKPYDTYQDASAAARALGVKTRKEYYSRYRENPRLPSNPELKYQGTFVSWPDYIGSGKISNQERSSQLYPTYSAARDAVKALGIKTAVEYIVRYKEDPRLPRTPDQKYEEDFVSWPDYLGSGRVSN